VTLSLFTIQAAARAGRIKWRYHALLRANERGISREHALQVLQHGEIIEQHPRTKPYPKCLMMGRVEGERPLYLALGYDHSADYLHVITVHWLDPDKWDDPWTRKARPSKKKRTL
jgi:hypothetical protein